MTGGWGTPTWMGGDPEAGETFVAGKDQQTAQDLLAAARHLGLESHVVRTVTLGFIVPDAVWDTTQELRLSAAGNQF